MPLKNKLFYWQRIGRSYLGRGKTQLSFWHERPAINPAAFNDVSQGKLGQYYMTLADKAEYQGPFDNKGIPLLDYHGQIGRQYNPIAIAQYGLAHFNKWQSTGASASKEVFLRQADWLVNNLKENKYGLKVWLHNFDFEYKQTLKAPWYSGLAQGQGISLLLRAFKTTNKQAYKTAAQQAFKSLLVPMSQGGVQYCDSQGDFWLEEYIISPPTHILNGFIWALWGVYDYWLILQDAKAKQLWNNGVQTLLNNLAEYDTGFWSLYELSGTKLPMLASFFYHCLHIAQLGVMYKITGQDAFLQTQAKWQRYQKSLWRRSMAKLLKAVFKILYY